MPASRKPNSPGTLALGAGMSNTPGNDSGAMPAVVRTPASSNVSVILLAPSISKTPGGITRYAQGLLASSVLRERGFMLHHVPTHQAGTWIRKLGCALQAGARLALGRGDARIAHALIASDVSCDRKLILLAEARYAGLFTVAHFHGSTLVEWLDGLSAAHRRWVIRTANRCDAVIALGARVADYLRQRGLEGHVHVIPNGVEGSPWRHTPPLGPKLVLFVGKLGARKGVPELLRSFQALAARHDTAKLVLMGDGDVNATRDLASTLGIADRVSCTGWTNSETVHANMEQATVLVLPSHNENMSLALLEAMIRGLPVITTPVGEHRSVIADGHDGLFVPPGDVPALRTAIERVLEDPDLAARLGRAARERVLRDFAISSNHQRIADVYDELSGTRNARAPHR